MDLTINLNDFIPQANTNITQLRLKAKKPKKLVNSDFHFAQITKTLDLHFTPIDSLRTTKANVQISVHLLKIDIFIIEWIAKELII